MVTHKLLLYTMLFCLLLTVSENLQKSQVIDCCNTPIKFRIHISLPFSRHFLSNLSLWVYIYSVLCTDDGNCIVVNHGSYL